MSIRRATGHSPGQYSAANISSTLSSDWGRAGVVNTMFASTGGARRGSSRNTYQLPEDTFAYVEDGNRPRILSPHLDEEINYMHRQPSYSENGDYGQHLNIPYRNLPEDVFADSQRYASPWNIHTSGLPREEGTVDGLIDYPGPFLDVPGGVRSYGRGDTGISSFSTSQESTDVRQETRPRGGRQPGMKLSPDLVHNVRGVRKTGACLRCSTLREKCSTGTPCERCDQNDGRKWSGCVRAFNELVEVFKPEILASRLQPRALQAFMENHTRIPPGYHHFVLPLSFGFGKTFYGFYGAEYDPTTEDGAFTHVIAAGEQHPETHLVGYGLPVFPINSDSKEVQRLILNWLKDTLKSRDSMEEWLTVSFPGQEVQWIHGLLRLIWQYSFQYWNESRLTDQDADESKLDESLLTAWMMAILVTMLSFPVTVPPGTREEILSWSRFVTPGYTYPDSSRPLNKCVKALLLDIYNKVVEKVMAALDQFRKRNIGLISEQHIGHIRCITILVVVVTCQLQTSVMDNSRMPPQGDISRWLNETHYHLHKVEGAFKNVVLFTRQRSRDWAKKRLREQQGNRVSDGDDNEIQASDGRWLQALLNGIRDIREANSEAIYSHRGVKFESLTDPSIDFHQLNMRRAFAFYFEPGPSEGRTRGSRQSGI